MSEEKISAAPVSQIQFVHEDEKAIRPLRLIISVVIIIMITVASFWVALNPQWVLGFGSWGYVGAFFISLIASATIILPAPALRHHCHGDGT